MSGAQFRVLALLDELLLQTALRETWAGIAFADGALALAIVPRIDGGKHSIDHYATHATPADAAPALNGRVAHLSRPICAGIGAATRSCKSRRGGCGACRIELPRFAGGLCNVVDRASTDRRCFCRRVITSFLNATHPTLHRWSTEWQ